MSKAIVVVIHRDRYYWPKLTVSVQGVFMTQKTADEFITSRLRAEYDRTRGRHWSKWNSMRVHDYRIVDEVGLKRLYAAAKASVTVRRKRAAEKAAKTRAKRRGASSAPNVPYSPFTPNY